MERMSVQTGKCRVGRTLLKSAAGWLVATGLVMGCDNPVTDGSGAATIEVSVAPLSASDIAGVEISVTGDGIEPPISSALSSVGGEWTGVIEGIPVGTDRTFTAEAFDEEGQVLYSGIADGVAIENGETVSVLIFLQQVSPPRSFENSVPRFTAVVVSASTVAAGEQVSLSVEAVDPDPADSLVFSWYADGGSFDVDDSADVVWTAPDSQGSYRLTVSATDPFEATAMLSIPIDVLSETDGGAAAVSLSLNTWPEIAGLCATPTRVDVDDIAVLDLTATDPDGDSLEYRWDADCDGSFNDDTIENPTFRLNALPAEGADCVLTVSVSDGRGGSNHASLALATGPGLGSGEIPPAGAIYSTGFEPGDPEFVNLTTSGEVSTIPPPGTVSRTGDAVITLSSITTSYQGRNLESEACILLSNDQDQVRAVAYGTASSDNGGNQVSARLTLLWYTDSECTVPHEDESSYGDSIILPVDSYEILSLEAVPPGGATTAKLRIDVRDDNGGDNTGDDWAVDDVSIIQ